MNKENWKSFESHKQVKSFYTNTTRLSSPFNSSNLIKNVKIVNQIKNNERDIKKFKRRKKNNSKATLASFHNDTLLNSCYKSNNIYITSQTQAEEHMKVFYDNFKQYKEIEKKNKESLKYQSQSMNHYEKIRSKLNSLHDPNKTSIKDFIVKTKDKFLCKYKIKTKQDSINRILENNDNNYIKYCEDIIDYKHSEKLLKSFFEKFDDYIKYINKIKDNEIQKLQVEITIKNEFDKQIQKINSVIKKQILECHNGAEYRRFSIMLKERKLELPYFMKDPMITINEFRKLYNSKIGKEGKKINEDVRYNNSGLSLIEIIKYENYLLSPCVFSSVDEFFDILNGLEDENIRMLAVYGKNSDLINKYKNEVLYIKEQENLQKSDILIKKERDLEEIININNQLQDQRDDAIKYSLNIKDDDTLLLDNINKIYNTIRVFKILKMKRITMINSNQTLQKLLEIESALNILNEEFNLIKNSKEYCSKLQIINDQINTEKKIRKYKLQKKLHIAKRERMKVEILNRANRKVVKYKRKIVSRFIKHKKENKSIKDSKPVESFEDMINYS